MPQEQLDKLPGIAVVPPQVVQLALSDNVLREPAFLKLASVLAQGPRKLAKLELDNCGLSLS